MVKQRTPERGPVGHKFGLWGAKTSRSGGWSTARARAAANGRGARGWRFRRFEVAASENNGRVRNLLSVAPFSCQGLATGGDTMSAIIYLVGLVVIVMAILSFVGMR